MIPFIILLAPSFLILRLGWNLRIPIAFLVKVVDGEKQNKDYK